MKEFADSCEIQLDQVIIDYYRLDHDIGFMWTLTSLAQFKLLGSEDSKRRALLAANLSSITGDAGISISQLEHADMVLTHCIRRTDGSVNHIVIFDSETGVTAYRDSSAGAFAAYGLLLIADQVGTQEASLYRNADERILHALYTNYGAWDSQTEEGLILHGTSTFLRTRMSMSR